MLNTIHSDQITIKRVNVAVVGDKAVGKTSLIHAFKNVEFSCSPIESKEPEVCHMYHKEDRRYLFSMRELHDEDWSPKRSNLSTVEFVLLCFDGRPGGDKLLSEKWSGQIADFFPAKKMFLVRTKCDQLYDNIEDASGLLELSDAVNAIRAFECSAKDSNGIEAILKELSETHDKDRPDEDRKPSMKPSAESISTSTSLKLEPGSRESKTGDEATPGCGGRNLAQSFAVAMPLVKQAAHNLVEIAWNPDCFPSVKERINSYVPFLFGTRPSYDYKRISEENRLKEEYHEALQRERKASTSSSSEPSSKSLSTEELKTAKDCSSKSETNVKKTSQDPTKKN